MDLDISTSYMVSDPIEFENMAMNGEYMRPALHS
jgi:hypothetical protein